MSIPMAYPGEARTFKDPLTGRPVRQLTTDENSWSHHFYFTENSFTRGREEIYFISDRDTPGAANVLWMDLPSGEMRRITAIEAPARISGHTKDPDSTRLLYWHDRTAMIMDLQTREAIPLYTVPEGFAPARLSLSCDKRTVAIQINEDIGVEHGINYAGFAEKMYGVKRSVILTAPAGGGEKARVLLRDTAEGGHLQFSPTDPNLLMFCHEGPWHLIHQRIYLLDAGSGEVWPCFRQGPEDSVGHEFFTQDGQIFFDNRGPGHDGTITSSRTQAVAQEAAETDFIPYVGVADRRGVMVRKYPMPFYLNHYHANRDCTRLVGDGVDDLFLIDLRQSAPSLTPLCRHSTSWHGQHTHCHPTYAWDDRHILYASDASRGPVQVYLLNMAI